MPIFARWMAAVVTALLFSAPALAADRTIVVLDASGSMWGQIDGKPKLEIARQSLRTVLQSLPADRELGLMAYGHRQKGSCEDIELVVPPAAGTADAITAAADSLKFLGKTPLTAAVRQAAEALKYTEEKATVILITDGLETCNADPCALGKELKAAGVDFTAHVVGFGLTADEGRQVACLAENTGGKYIQATDAAGLEEALKQTVVEKPAAEPKPAPAPEPAKVEFNLMPTLTLAEGSPDITTDIGQSWVLYKANADGSRGDYVSTEYGAWKGNAEPGKYILVAKVGHVERDQVVSTEADKVAAPHYVLDAGTLIVRAHASEGSEIADGAAIQVKYPGEGTATYYGQMQAVFPAGEQEITVEVGEGTATEKVTLKAGETIEKDIAVGVGKVVTNAFYVEGKKVDSGGLVVRVFKAEKNLDGQREDVSTSYGPDQKFDLPPGNYVVMTKMDEASAESPFTVKVGEKTDVNVVLNAGVLSVDAKGAKEIEIYGAKKDIEGKRQAFGNSYGETHQSTLPAGDYVVVAIRGDDNVKTEIPVTVKAGERAEVSVP
ncbi:vWA domain-containing protein [Mesorhizobium retamae]|uniref:VWA domain-containing protein n=1 Tax=Mesorhizobium retamae TaxID=2912854 RepID=A0ABS9QH37_9HYPH|nr:VWA domain-containing protein [Mesorhizobium sp. IRAMC:0171]MCG7506740.1 VWA domain-containing protein [Mesorhizobium sp. IRAMC:0171]